MKQNKAWLGAFAFVIMAGISMLTFAFKADNTVNHGDQKSNKVFLSQWYDLSQTGASEANQIINTNIAGKPNTTDCRASNPGLRCAVELSFPGAIPPTVDLTGESVAQILLDYPGTTVNDQTKRP